MVVVTGVLAIVVQLVFRAWALYPSWFFLDDYNLLRDAASSRLSVDYLLTPYNGHLMPGGRLLVWLVSESGALNWQLGATFTLVSQALASGAALWMLTTLFGTRWAILAPLSLYLTSAITLPAFVWWAAALNQVAVQLAFFLALGAWVRYLRGRRTKWLVAAIAAVGLGLLFDVKALLILPVMAFVVVAYFASGGVLQRLRTTSVRYWPAAGAAVATAVAYVAYYTGHVEQPFVGASASLAGRVADSLLGTAFAAGALGGPWRWSMPAPPTAMADPPAVGVRLVWVVAALVVIYGALRRRRTLRAWLLLAVYLLGLLALLVTSRAPAFGASLGLEYRYLTDAACVLALCVGLAFLPLRGAPESSARREDPLLRVEVPNYVVILFVLAVSASGLVSSALYATQWHSENASDAYMHNLSDSIRAEGTVDLADTEVPEDVQSHLTAPDNTTRALAPLISDRVRFPSASPRLAVAATDGTLHQAVIQPGVTSPPGPRPDCGWRVTGTGRSVPLTGRAFPWVWWVRIGYLASQDSPVTVSAGDTSVTTTIDAGLHSLYVEVDGSFDTVDIDGLAPGVSMCVDTVEVGQPVAGEGLQ